MTLSPWRVKDSSIFQRGTFLLNPSVNSLLASISGRRRTGTSEPLMADLEMRVVEPNGPALATIRCGQWPLAQVFNLSASPANGASIAPVAIMRTALSTLVLPLIGPARPAQSAPNMVVCDPRRSRRTSGADTPAGIDPSLQANAELPTGIHGMKVSLKGALAMQQEKGMRCVITGFVDGRSAIAAVQPDEPEGQEDRNDPAGDVTGGRPCLRGG